MSTEFKRGDIVVCVNHEDVSEHLKAGHRYVVSDTHYTNDGITLVCICGIDDIGFRSDRFIPAIDTVAQTPKPVAKRDVFAYLKTGIEEYDDEPAETAYDCGYLAALKDVMQDAFGMVTKPVQFVPEGANA